LLWLIGKILFITGMYAEANRECESTSSKVVIGVVLQIIVIILRIILEFVWKKGKCLIKQSNEDKYNYNNEYF
jgi:hypothetical protein